MSSIWEMPLSSYGGALDKNIERDIVVVGGGIAGLLAAYQLTERGKSVTLVEADTICSGGTKNTTAHIESLQGFLYSELIKKSLDKAKLYYKSQMQAIENYKKLIQKYNIDCDFNEVNSHLFGSEKNKIKAEYNALKKIGASCEYLENFNFAKSHNLTAVKVYGQAVFHPLKFLKALPKNFEIIEHTRIIKVDTKYNILYSEKGSITANKITIATNFPIIDFPGMFFLKMYKSSSYTVAVQSDISLDGAYQSAAESGVTYRQYNDYMIIGGLDHRTGRENCENKFARLIEKAKLLDKKAAIKYRWAANDCITFDNIPYIGKYSKNSENLFVITGFNKWGMANSMIASLIIADLIEEKPNECEKLFCPSRCVKKIANAAINSAQIFKNILVNPILPPFKTAKSVERGSGKIAFYNGKKRAVYKDKDGKIFAIHPLCAHLKCQLQFNKELITWDCPCHGSRYDIHGNIITAPTVKNQAGDR